MRDTVTECPRDVSSPGVSSKCEFQDSSPAFRILLEFLPLLVRKLHGIELLTLGFLKDFTSEMVLWPWHGYTEEYIQGLKGEPKKRETPVLLLTKHVSYEQLCDIKRALGPGNFGFTPWENEENASMQDVWRTLYSYSFEPMDFKDRCPLLACIDQQTHTDGKIIIAGTQYATKFVFPSS